jgi:prevent-host-death family protein
MKHTINVKELRASLPDIIKKVRLGDQYVVLYRSRPAFRIMAVDAEEELTIPLSDDPIYRAPAIGRSSDGLTSQDHDLVLYGKNGR